MKTKIFDGDYPLTSPYGWRTSPITGAREFHNGSDFSMPIGTNLLVPDTFDNSKVRLNTKDKFGGLYIQLQREDGKGCYWLHNSKNILKVGAVVKAGQVIAKSGNSGNTTGPHVHFGVQSNATVWGSHEDPMPYIILEGNPMEFKIGDKIEITTSQNIRKGSGNSYDITGKTKVGDLWTIKDGPRTAGGYTWWDAQQDGGGTGWLADGGWFKIYEEPPVTVDPCQDIKDELKSVREQLGASQAQIREVVQENDKLHDEIEKLEAECLRLESEINTQTPAIEEDTEVLLAIVEKRVEDEKSKL